MVIKGFQPTSLIDYPGKVCSIIFISKCNFRCGYCHNKELVLDSDNLKEIPEQLIIDHLQKRKNLVDGVVITGGEPLLHRDIQQLIEKIKQLNYLIKLDTNGSFPQILQELINQNLLDYIAMDVKAPLEKEKYEKTINTNIDIDKIKQSIKIIKQSGIDHEFRTTVVPSLLTKEDVIEIAKSLAGANKFIIQRFEKPRELLDPNFNNEKPYSDEELEDIRKECEEFVETEIR